MKSLILLFVFLLSSMDSESKIQKIQTNIQFSQQLDTSTTKSGYFYLEVAENSDLIYLYLSDDKYNLTPDTLEVCLTDKEPVNIKEVSLPCKFRPLYSYYKSSYNKASLVQYLYRYKYPLSENKRYIIVKYTGINPTGTLKVRASYNEINLAEKKEEKLPEYVFEYDTSSSAYDTARTAVEAWVIIVIVISVISVVVPVVIVIIVVCVCRRRTVYAGAPMAPMGYVGQPNVVVYNPQAPAYNPQAPAYNPPPAANNPPPAAYNPQGAATPLVS